MGTKAFTLVEVVVTAIIVGILAMTAIPNLLKSIQRSYGQDALRNLVAIYGAQQNYFQNNNGAYLSPCTINCINGTGSASLGLNIVSTGGTVYSCPNGTACTATNGNANFTMNATLGNPINIGSVPVYCGNGSPPYANNPCCQGGTAGAVCP